MSRLIGIFILTISFTVGWFWMAYENAVKAPLGNAETVSFEIRKGDSLKRVIDELTARGILQEPLWFKVLAYRRKVAAKLQAGEYEIPSGLDSRQLLDLMVSGRVRRYSLTILEGWSFNQMRAAIAGHPAIEQTLVGIQPKAILSKISSEYSHPEGLFFPDTYHFNKGFTDLDVLRRAFKKMQKIIESEWPRRAEGLPLDSPYDALILASIVEKETGKNGERDIIAGVFTRRLKKNMRLQTDPTVIYGMGDRYQGNIRLRDLRADTPYNTYMRAGLPPTPIAMPGLESIRAALHPDDGSSLYFVARGDGSHVFSSTLKEHNRAVDVFQKKKSVR